MSYNQYNALYIYIVTNEQSYCFYITVEHGYSKHPYDEFTLTVKRILFL